MKKLFCYTLLLALAAVFGCEDPALDPLQAHKVKKGTLLALRGRQLENIYNNGLPGAEMFPKAVDGTEIFAFDAEYLDEDPTTLESFDISDSLSRTALSGLDVPQLYLRQVGSLLDLRTTFPEPERIVVRDQEIELFGRFDINTLNYTEQVILRKFLGLAIALLWLRLS